MWENEGPDEQIKVVNFGLLKKFGHGKTDEMTASAGTHCAMAPQVLQGVHASQVDPWSCGVIICMLLTSTRPFHHKFKLTMIDKILHAKCVMDGDRWNSMSCDSNDLVANLSKSDPKQCFAATQALEHPWIKNTPSHESGKLDESVNKSSKKTCWKTNIMELKKIALNIIAHRSSSKEINELQKCFDHHDTSSNGIIEVHEFKAAMASAHFNDAEIEEMFKSVASF